jgi:hypothetical protein
MNVRAVSLFFALVFGFRALPAQAQGPGGPPFNPQQLVAQVAALAAGVTALQGQVNTLQRQVAKVQGNITAADLVGTYNLIGFDLKLTDGTFDQVTPSITHEVLQGTITLNADGSTSLSMTGAGHRVALGSPLFFLNESGTGIGTWTYDNGTVSLSDVGELRVAAGGRVLVGGDSRLTSAGGSDMIAILTRLQ